MRRRSTETAASSPRIGPSDMAEICDALFHLLSRQFKHVLSGAIFSAQAHTDPQVEVSPKGFLQLLRCCMISLQPLLSFPEFKARFKDKCWILIHVLRELLPPNSGSHISTFSADINLETGEPTDSQGGVPASFLCAILEVFMHELLAHHQLRKDFSETYLDSSTVDFSFVSCHSLGGISTILELFSGHFLLSIHNGRAFNKFMNSLSWLSKADEDPEVGLSAALALLETSGMFSIPHLLQAHLILLVSRCIGIHTPVDNRKPSPEMVNHYLTALELSAKFYEDYMSALQFVDNLIAPKVRSVWRSKEPFHYCIRELIYDEIKYQIDNLADFCLTHSNGVLCGTEVEIINYSSTYIIETQHIIDEVLMDEICLILNHIILSILNGETERKTLLEDGEGIQQEIYCLAAVLKLMSSSLVQILRHMKQNGLSISMHSCKDSLIRKQYDYVSGVISCFGKYESSQPIQVALFNLMETDDRFKELKLMLAHFASLLSYSFKKRLDFLWRSSIFMMIVLSNLAFYEEGSLDIFRSLVGTVKESPFLQSSLENTSEGSIRRRSSVIMASNFHNIQKLYLKDHISFLTYEDPRMGAEDGKEIAMRDGSSGFSSCNGEAYVSCLPDYKKEPSEFDDLVDFIECMPGKDHSGYLSKRSKFFGWRQKRRLEMKMMIQTDHLKKRIRFFQGGMKGVVKHGKNSTVKVHWRKRFRRTHSLSNRRYS